MAEAMDGQGGSGWLMEGRLTRCREVEGRILLSLFIIHHGGIGMDPLWLLRKLSLSPLQGFLAKEAKPRRLAALARISILAVGQVRVVSGQRSGLLLGGLPLFCLQRTTLTAPTLSNQQGAAPEGWILPRGSPEGFLGQAGGGGGEVLLSPLNKGRAMETRSQGLAVINTAIKEEAANLCLAQILAFFQLQSVHCSFNVSPAGSLTQDA